MISCRVWKQADMLGTELVRSWVGPTIVFVFPDVTRFFPFTLLGFRFQEGSLNALTQETAKNSDLFSFSGRPHWTKDLKAEPKRSLAYLMRKRIKQKIKAALGSEKLK